MSNIDKILLEFEQALHKVNTLEQLDNLTIAYLGRNGSVNKLFSSLKDVSVDKKKEYGQKINELKALVTRFIEVKKDELVKKKDEDTVVDVTLPGTKYAKGSLHLVSYAIEQIGEIFAKIGFVRMTYPEVEWEHFSFDALNMPKSHPARDDFETFFIDLPEDKKYGKMILTPHTSSGQIREMLRLKKPPIRMINIAKCYRPNWDVTHTPMFHQFEGMVVDKDINITHLKGTINYFAKEFFGKKRETRLRPFHFQFTEPSFEVDISCGICLGKGIINGQKCKLCKSGWIELGGSGMIHPNVLKAGGIDPQEYTGWAFGIGVERVMMMKEGIKLDDMRIMYANDIRFLEQF